METIGVNSENVGKNPYPSIRRLLPATRKWDLLSFVLKVQAEVSILFEILPPPISRGLLVKETKCKSNRQVKYTMLLHALFSEKRIITA